MNIVLALSAMGSGGAERVAATLCNAWSERGDQVTIVPTFSQRGDCFYSISPRVTVRFLSDEAKVVGRSPRAYWRRFWALRRLFRTLAPDVIVSFLTNVNVAVIAASRGQGIP